jgi:ubiquinone/menaquinone biosynthesis C-methylase UbiE
VKKELPSTGERLVTSVSSYVAIDHLHRYALAAQLAKNKDVLDIASGEGYGSNLLSKISKSVIGVDISSEAVLHAKEKYANANLEFRQGSANKIPLQDCSVDMVVSFETIEHHDLHDEMLQEFKRVLRPHGIVIISSPDKLNYSDIPNYSNPFHVKELYKAEFVSLINRFFKYATFYNQKNISGSLMVPDSSHFSFQEYKGNYSSLEKFEGLQSPIYNLCIASDSELSAGFASFFCGKSTEEYETRIASMKKKIAKLETEAAWVKKLKTSWLGATLIKFRSLIKVFW